MRRHTTLLVVAALASVVALSGCTPPSGATRPCTQGVGVIGDSLTVGLKSRIGRELTKRGCSLAWIDARVGRTTTQGVAVLNSRAAARRLPRIVVVALGTNDVVRRGEFTARIDQVMRIAAANKTRVVWVNVDRPGDEASFNAALTAGARRWPALRVMDWNSYVDRNPQLRGADGVHLRTTAYPVRGSNREVRRPTMTLPQ